MTQAQESTVIDDGSPCFTEAELAELKLLPVPDWARKPPGPSQPGLFDDDDS
jgi:hypothetical protein